MLDRRTGRAYVPSIVLGLARPILSFQPCEGQMGSTSFGGANPADVTRPASPQQNMRRGKLGRVSRQGPV